MRYLKLPTVRQRQHQGHDYTRPNKQNSQMTRSSTTVKSTAHRSCSVGVLYDISREKIRWLLWPRKLSNSAK